MASRPAVRAEYATARHGLSAGLHRAPDVPDRPLLWPAWPASRPAGAIRWPALRPDQPAAQDADMEMTGHWLLPVRSLPEQAQSTRFCSAGGQWIKRIPAPVPRPRRHSACGLAGQLVQESRSSPGWRSPGKQRCRIVAQSLLPGRQNLEPQPVAQGKGLVVAASWRQSISCPASHCSIDCLDWPSKGRISRPFCGIMPTRPSRPLPRPRCSRIVSAWSSRWWARAIRTGTGDSTAGSQFIGKKRMPGLPAGVLQPDAPARQPGRHDQSGG